MHTQAARRRRNRKLYFGLIVTTIVLGLSSRRFPGMVPAILGKYPGDALWALMVFFILGAVFPRASTLRVAVSALMISCAVEFLKLCQASWLVAIRDTTAGHLVFGHVFSWQNLVAYTLGVGVGAAFEILLGAVLPKLIRPDAAA